MALNQQGYTSQILAGGTSNGREATGEDFGAGVAQGMANVGRGLDSVANVANQIDQDQGRVWAATAVSQKELAWRQDFTKSVDSLDPTSADYPSQINNLSAQAGQSITQAQQDLMDQAPTRSARKFVSWHMASAGLRMNDMAMQTQSKLNADYTTGLVGQGIKADTDLIAASPDNDTFSRVLQKQHDSIVGLNTIGPDVKSKLLTDVQHQYSVAQATSVMSADPQGFLSSINLQGGIRRPNGAQVGGVATQAPGDGSTSSSLIDAVMHVESGGNPNAVSPKGAQGLMQLMPGTAANPGFGIAPAKDGSPEENKRVGSQYLGALMDKYQGNTALSLAAYNAGPGAVDGALSKAGGSARMALGMLPAETQAYVPKVMAQMRATPRAPMYVAGAPEGLVQQGNIDIANRQVATNPDGSISTVRSMSISEDGRSILIPTVVGGKVVSNADAIAHYHQTGEQLGVFQTDQQADAYSQGLHEQQAQMYDPVPRDPQVNPLSEQAIAGSQPPMAGWKNLGFGEKVQLVRQAEGLVGKQLASTRGAGQVQFQDAMASFSAGQDYPDVEKLKAQNLVTLPLDEAQRKNDVLDAGRQFAGFKAQVATMPDAQAEAWINQHKPEGGDEFAVKQPLYQMALSAFGSAQNDRRTKPTDFAVTNKIADAAPLDLSDAAKFGAGLRQRVAVNSTMQRDYGAPASIFTQAEVPQVMQAMDKLSSHDAVSYMGSMATALGNTRDYQTAMSQIGQKNPTLAYVGHLAQTGAQVVVGDKPMAATDIAAAVLDGDRILNKQFDTSKGNDVPMPSGANAVKINENQFAAAFSRALPATAFQSPNAAQAAGQQKEIFNAVKDYYVSQAYHQGKPLDQIDPKDVKAAVDAVTGGVVKQSGGALMLPYGMKSEDFQSQWNSRRDAALVAAGHSQEDIDRTGGNLLPINAGDGKYRFMNGTNLLINPRTGQPVTVDYAQPAPAVAAVPATDWRRALSSQPLTPRL